MVSPTGLGLKLQRENHAVFKQPFLPFFHLKDNFRRMTAEAAFFPVNGAIELKFKKHNFVLKIL